MIQFICFLSGSFKLQWPKRQQPSSTMDECFDKPERVREFLKPVLFVSLVLPIIYYMFYYKADIESKGVISAGILGLVNRKLLPQCNVRITRNGSVQVQKELKKDLDLNTLYPMVKLGGHYTPRKCRSKYKVAILVPFRDRQENLRIFLYNIHPFLMRQKLEYRIFVFEQNGTKPFNRGRLFNAGFLEIKRYDYWLCVIFHDVDLLPTTYKIQYTCPILPRHMCAIVEEKKNDPTFKTTFGGVTAMTMDQYEKANGYSNMYWGWGGEDNDMFQRIRAARLGATRYNKTYGRYASLKHSRTPANPMRYMLLKMAEQRYKSDGLSNIRYRILSYTSKPLYTHVMVDVDDGWMNHTTTDMPEEANDM